MGWSSCLASDLVVGDAILLTRTVEVREPGIKRLVRYRHTGRVLAVIEQIYTDKWDSAVAIERVDDALPMNRWNARTLGVDIVEFRDLNETAVRLRRHTDRGPARRRSDDGRAYMLDLLHRAAGGDHNSDDAIRVVSECAAIEELDRARRDGDLPMSVGPAYAKLMLEGLIVVSEAILRQLDGRMPKQTCQGHDPDVVAYAKSESCFYQKFRSM